MSQIRTGHGPDDWRPEGPASPYSVQRLLANVPVATVGAMRPVLSAGPLPMTAGEATRRRVRSARKREERAP